MRDVTRRAAAAAMVAAVLMPPTAIAADTVKVGLAGQAVDAAFYIARDYGYFKDEGIDVDFTVFDSGAKQIASLGTHEIDVGSGAASAGLYNAMARGIGIRIVADKGHTEPGSFYNSLMVRKDLVESGKFKGLKDLKGLRMGFAAPGISILSLANEAAKAGGLQFTDITPVFMSFPQQVAAFQTKAIDASIMPEPGATLLLATGNGVRVMSTEQFYPSHQITMVFYSERFAKDKPELAVKFMRAYLRAMRTYRDAVKDGKLRGHGAAEVIQTMVKNFNIKADLIAQMYSQSVDPDGNLLMASLQKDLDFFRSQGLVTTPVELAKVVDLSFAQKAAAALGPYKPKGQ
jgi:NitT/TauT family transport system substrate-binding protein